DARRVLCKRAGLARECFPASALLPGDGEVERMIVVIDASGDPQLAKSCLARRGIEFTVVLERRDLKPGAVLGTLARLRKSPIDACYIFCRHLSVQYNRFGLK